MSKRMIPNLTPDQKQDHDQYDCSLLLQVEGLVLQQRLDHPHQVDQDGEVVLHHVHTNSFRYEGAQTGQHLREEGVAGADEGVS